MGGKREKACIIDIHKDICSRIRKQPGDRVLVTVREQSHYCGKAPEAVREFSERLKCYKTSKGTIQIPYSGRVPAELICDMEIGIVGKHAVQRIAMLSRRMRIRHLNIGGCFIAGRTALFSINEHLYLRMQAKAAGKELVRMKKLFYYADEYIAESSWRDLAMLKFCLFAMGVLAGMGIPKKNRKKAGRIAAVVFAVTYIPLMAKFFSVIMDKEFKNS